MRIKLVQLENIRSHVKSTVPLESGFNCLVGGLGCGKSSVLYAIDFALFGDPIGRSYNYLLREGADIGKVALQFVHNGRTYTIIRALRKKGNRISQDMEQLKLFEGEKLLASAKNEAVAEQLKAITGLDKEFFREIVWMRQEHLKELLDVAPRQRQKRLDELFGLSDYETAWSNLAELKREYDGEKKAYERDYDVLAVDKLQTEYNKSVEEFAEIEKRLHELRREVIEAEAALEQAEKRLQGLEQLRRQTEELRERERNLQTKVESLVYSRSQLRRQIQEKTVYIEELEKNLTTLEVEEESCRKRLQGAGLKADQTVDELQGYIAALDEQMTSLRAEQEAAMKEIRIAEQKASTLVAESRCPLCLQPLKDDYKTNLMKKLDEENTERQKRLAELKRNLEELTKLRNLVNKTLHDLQSILVRKESLKKQVEREKVSLKRLLAESEEKKSLEENFRAQLNEVRVEIDKFDLSELEVARKQRDEAFRNYSKLKSNLEVVESRKVEVSRRINDLKNRLESVEQKIGRMKRIEEILELIVGIRNAYRSIQPRIRREFVSILERVVQRVLDGLVGAQGPSLVVRIDETYTPSIRSEEGYGREVSNLSGGERTLLAFAYRLGLGQLITQSRMGHGLHMLILDEPTESLGSEDGSIERLAEAISKLRAIEQIIAVTHSEAFAEKAEHVVRFEKEMGVSQVSVEKSLQSK